MTSKLDQIVKGAPPPNVSPSKVAQGNDRDQTPLQTPEPLDPTTLLPSSPPQIYLNLLILEASLRAQYLHLLSRRRQNTSALTLLALWLAYFSYAQFLKARTDGSGIVGGSPYWAVDTGEKMALMGGGVLAVLFWATGQWERGVRWPRRWIAVTNRGLRGFNCKVVVLKGKWWRESLGQLICLMLPLALFWPAFDSRVMGTPGNGGEYAKVEYTNGEKRAMLKMGQHIPRHMDPVEEDIASGGDVVKLLLLPKPFTPDFRENWEIFRTEYWDTENARRAELRKRVRAKQKEAAKQEVGWLWWTGWRGWPTTSKSRSGTPEDAEKGRPHSHAHTHSLTHQRELKDRKRRSSTLSQRMERNGSHSRSSSRSSTVTVDGESDRQLKGSGSIAERGRRRKAPSMREGMPARPSPLTPAGSRPGTPGSGTAPGSFRESTLRKQASSLSTGSEGSDSTGDVKVKTEPGETP